MTRRNKKIEQPVVIAVEGLDYFYTLLNQIDGKPQGAGVQLWDFAEQLSFKDNFELLIDESAFKKGDVRALGIIKDAEEDRHAWESALQALLYSVNPAVPTAQLQVAKGSPHTGYLLMPHDEPSGCLEHACLKACALSAERLACAEAYYGCVSKHYVVPINSNKQAKVKVHAIIASHHDSPAMTLGQSTKAGVKLWDFNHPSLKVMIDFIELMRSA